MMKQILEKYEHYMSSQDLENPWSQNEIKFLLKENQKLREVIELIAGIYRLDERNSSLESIRYYARKALGFDE